MLRKIITQLFIISPLMWQTAKAQSPQEIMEAIYKNYDSTEFLAFDIRFTYNSDTINGDYIHDVLQGSYTMAGRKAKYTLGPIDFMQNDSFFIAVYNDDKFIIVSNPRTSNAGNELPMRQAIDSLLRNYAQQYRITITAIDEDQSKINFSKTDSLALFNNFSIIYNPQTKFLHAIEYDFQEESEAEQDTRTENMPLFRQKKLTIEFFNYRIDNFLPDLYDENNYIWFEDGECKPVNKYKDFTIHYSRSDHSIIPKHSISKPLNF